MRWINYECCNGQQTRATSHEIVRQQKTTTHYLRTVSLPSGVYLQGIQDYKVLWILWRTVYAPRGVYLQGLQDYRVLWILWRTVYAPSGVYLQGIHDYRVLWILWRTVYAPSGVYLQGIHDYRVLWVVWRTYGRLYWRRNVDWGFSRTECWGGYLDLREVR